MEAVNVPLFSESFVRGSTVGGYAGEPDCSVAWGGYGVWSGWVKIPVWVCNVTITTWPVPRVMVEAEATIDDVPSASSSSSACP